jgi:hypothetical protein
MYEIAENKTQKLKQAVLSQNSARCTKIVNCGKISAYRFVTIVSKRSEVVSYVDVTAPR